MDHTQTEKPTNSLADITSRLTALEGQLKRTGPQSAAPFNAVYHIITSGIGARLDRGEFKHAPVERRLAVDFADRYFNALDQHLTSGKADSAWSALFTLPATPRRPLLWLTLGVNAHILNDLPLALLAADTGATGFRRDFLRSGTGINDCLPRLARLLRPETRPLPPWLVITGMFVMVHVWRWQAWWIYRRLATGKTTPEGVRHRAGLNAHRLIRFWGNR